MTPKTQKQTIAADDGHSSAALLDLFGFQTRINLSYMNQVLSLNSYRPDSNGQSSDMEFENGKVS